MKRMIPTLAVLSFAALLLLHPETATAAMEEGLLLCFRTVIPSLFPFFIVTSLLTQLGFAGLLQKLFAPFMGPLFKMRGVCALPLLAGLLGGYPTGAKTTADLCNEGVIFREEAERLLGFCNNCGPAFLLGYVGGGVLGDPILGARLLLIHITSALLTGMLLCRMGHVKGPVLLPCHMPDAPLHLPRIFTGAVTGSLISMLNICAYVVIFRTAAALLPLPDWGLGALEMVSGLAVLSPNKAGFILSAAITAWGGLSVHCQTMAVSGELSMRWHWLGKALQTVIAAALALLFFPQ